MVYGIILDIVLVLVMLIGVIVGLKIGFVKAVARPVKGILAWVIAFASASAVGNNLLKPMICAPITNQLSSFLYERYADVSAQTVGESLPTLLKMAAGICGVDINAIVANGGDTQEVISAIVSAVADPFIGIVSVIVSFIVLLFVSKLLLGLVLTIVNAIVDHGLLGKANRIFGCLFTFLLSVIVIWAFTALFAFIVSLPAIAESGFSENFVGGVIFNFFKSINPIDLLLSF